MSPDFGFPLFLAVTVAFLIGAIVTGFKARIPVHLTCVAGALVSLCLAIWFAIQLGPLYDLETAQPITDVHLLIAKLATFSFVLPLISGIATLRERSPKHRKRHLVCAMIAVVLTVAATVTGAWMLWLAERVV